MAGDTLILDLWDNEPLQPTSARRSSPPQFNERSSATHHSPTHLPLAPPPPLTTYPSPLLQKGSPDPHLRNEEPTPKMQCIEPFPERDIEELLRAMPSTKPAQLIPPLLSESGVGHIPPNSSSDRYTLEQNLNSEHNHLEIIYGSPLPPVQDDKGTKNEIKLEPLPPELDLLDLNTDEQNALSPRSLSKADSHLNPLDSRYRLNKLRLDSEGSYPLPRDSANQSIQDIDQGLNPDPLEQLIRSEEMMSRLFELGTSPNGEKTVNTHNNFTEIYDQDIDDSDDLSDQVTEPPSSSSVFVEEVRPYEDEEHDSGKEGLISLLKELESQEGDFLSQKNILASHIEEPDGPISQLPLSHEEGFATHEEDYLEPIGVTIAPRPMLSSLIGRPSPKNKHPLWRPLNFTQPGKSIFNDITASDHRPPPLLSLSEPKVISHNDSRPSSHRRELFKENNLSLDTYVLKTMCLALKGGALSYDPSSVIAIELPFMDIKPVITDLIMDSREVENVVVNDGALTFQEAHARRVKGSNGATKAKSNRAPRLITAIAPADSSSHKKTHADQNVAMSPSLEKKLGLEKDAPPIRNEDSATNVDQNTHAHQNHEEHQSSKTQNNIHASRPSGHPSVRVRLWGKENLS